ncbi:MAG: hypothetical protein RIB78_08205 [Gammaproteobacteria bacterium]
MLRLLLLLVFSPAVMAAPLTLVCYDELDRKSTILTFAADSNRVMVEESGDAFACAPDFEMYCTTSAGEVVDTGNAWRVSWVRELSGERSVYEINKENLAYTAEYAGAVWASRCERLYMK